MLPFVRGVDLSGNDFKVRGGEGDSRRVTPRPSLRAAPSALPGPTGGAGGPRRVFPGLPRPRRKTGAGAQGTRAAQERGPAGLAPEPVTPRAHALAGYRPTLCCRASRFSSGSPWLLTYPFGPACLEAWNGKGC